MGVVSINVLLLGSSSAWEQFGYKGAFVHPNSLGIFLVIAVLAVFYLKDWGSRRYDTVIRFALATCIAIIAVASNCRGFFFSTFVAITITTFFMTDKRGGREFAKNSTSIIVAFFALILIAILYDDASSYIYEYLSKGRVGLRESVDGRLRLMENQLENFGNNPLFGIGFGLHSDFDWWINESGKISYDPFFQLPIAAPAEKASFVSAIPEETGLVGVVLIAMQFLSWAREGVRLKSPGLFATLIASWAINMSEYCFFSAGGIGLLLWMALHVMQKTDQPQPLE